MAWRVWFRGQTEDDRIYIGSDQNGQDLKLVHQSESSGLFKDEMVWTCAEDNGYVGQRMLKMKMPGRSKRKKRFVDAVKDGGGC